MSDLSGDRTMETLSVWLPSLAGTQLYPKVASHGRTENMLMSRFVRIYTLPDGRTLGLFVPPVVKSPTPCAMPGTW